MRRRKKARKNDGSQQEHNGLRVQMRTFDQITRADSHLIFGFMIHFQGSKAILLPFLFFFCKIFVI